MWIGHQNQQEFSQQGSMEKGKENTTRQKQTWNCTGVGRKSRGIALPGAETPQNQRDLSQQTSLETVWPLPKRLHSTPNLHVPFSHLLLDPWSRTILQQEKSHPHMGNSDSKWNGQKRLHWKKARSHKICQCTQKDAPFLFSMMF